MLAPRIQTVQPPTRGAIGRASPNSYAWSTSWRTLNGFAPDPVELYAGGNPSTYRVPSCAGSAQRPRAHP